MAIRLRIKDRKRKSKNKRHNRNSRRRKTYKKKMKGGACGCSSKLNIFSGGSKVPALMGHEITGEPLNLQQVNLIPETSNTGFHFKQPVMEGGKKKRKYGKKHKKSKKHQKSKKHKSRRKTHGRKRKSRSRRRRKQGGGGILSTVGLDDINYAMYGAENAIQSSFNVLKGDSPVVSSNVMKGQYAHE